MKKSQIGMTRKIGPKYVTSVSSRLTLAELCLQRGEFEQARRILEQRIGLGNMDFKTRNLFGISLAHLKQYDEAQAVFQSLAASFRSKEHRVKARFNLGLARFFEDLSQTGDLTVTRFNGMNMARTPYRAMPASPFTEAMSIWREMASSRRPVHGEIIHTFLSFAYLQAGDIDGALSELVLALSQHESFFVTHYVIGRVFMDLYYLAAEGTDFMLAKETMEFFEIEEYESFRKSGDLFAIQKETFLDIAMQAYLEGRSLSPICPEILLGLAHAYILADLYEEAQEVMAQLETLIPNSLAVLETSLYFHTCIQAPPNAVSTIFKRVKAVLRKNPQQLSEFVMPAYYLF